MGGLVSRPGQNSVPFTTMGSSWNQIPFHVTPPLEIRFSGKGLPKSCILQGFFINTPSSATTGQLTINCNSGNRMNTKFLCPFQ